jgi:cytochrome c peroxidase
MRVSRLCLCFSLSYDDGSYGPLLVRLAWHSSGTYDKKKGKFGSDGATMRFSKESNHGANAGLQIARDLLEPIKKKYEGCSYADLYTLAGGVAIEAMGGPKIGWRNGRSDAKDESSCPPDGSLPDASQGQDHIRNIFYRMSVEEHAAVRICATLPCRCSPLSFP